MASNMELPEGLIIEDLEIPRRAIVDFIREYLKRSGLEGIILGLSGGIDSALVTTLATEALGPDRVRVMLLPVYEEKDEQNINDAKLLIQQLGITSVMFELKDAVAAFHPLELDKICLGNVAARLRMITLYAMANKHRLLVGGTGNRSEILTGYFTKYGDGACDILPIAGLYKVNVRRLSAHLGIPKQIVDKVPSAGLWANQTDEGELGITYDELDSVLFLRFDQGFEFDAIVEWGIEKKKVERVYNLIKTSQHKRNPIPTPEL